MKSGVLGQKKESVEVLTASTDLKVFGLFSALFLDGFRSPGFGVSVFHSRAPDGIAAHRVDDFGIGSVCRLVPLADFGKHAPSVVAAFQG